MEIISKQNEKIKNLIRLKDKKERRKTNLFIVETEKLLNEAISCNFKVKELYYCGDEPKIECESKFKLSEKLMQYVSSLSTASNILAVLEMKEMEANGNKFLVLENIQDPSNLGAITRTAYASGFNSIYCINCVDEFELKCLRSSMGAIFRLSINRATIKDIKGLDFEELVCASMEGDNIYLQAPFPEKIGLVIGNEGHGVSDELKSICTKTYSIPMQEGLESLNASVSAGLMMYAIKYNLKEGK
jgi:TrmH family RNA methyltransferase